MSIQHWDGFVVVFANQVAKWPNFDLKVGNELCTQVEEANKGVQRLARCGEWPVSDKVKFGRDRAVALRLKVKANPFNSVKEEVTFLWVE